MTTSSPTDARLSFDFTPQKADSDPGPSGVGGQAHVDLAGGSASSGAQDSLAAWNYYFSQSKPISINLLGQSPTDGGGSSAAGAGSAPTDDSTSGLSQSSPFGLDASAVADVKGASHGGGGGGGGGGGTPPPQYVASNGYGLQFVVNWDSSVGNAPSGFVSGFETAVQYFLDTYASSKADLTSTLNPVSLTITLDAGYGEVLGSSLPFGVLGESNFNVNSFSYSQLYNAMKGEANQSTDQTTAYGTLPTSDPLNATNYLVSSADQKALGLKLNDTSLDGGVGFAKSSRLIPWNFTGTTTSGQYDFISVAKHEISEVMGREAWVGMNVADGTTTYNNSYSNLDLFRYASFDATSGVGIRSTTTGGTAYLSINGGQTNLSNYNTNPSSGDLGDWAGTTQSNDAYNYAGGGPQQISSADTRELNVLGYTTQLGIV